MFDFDVDAIRQAGFYPFLLEELLGCLLLQQVNEGGISGELDRAFRDSQDTFGFLQDNLCIGTVTGADKGIVRDRDGSLDFELDGTVLLDTLGRNIFEVGREAAAFHGTNGQVDRHTGVDTSDFCLIDIPLEYHVIHISYGGNRRAIVEVVRLDNRVTYLDRNIKYHPADCTANLSRTGDIGVTGDTVADNLEFALRSCFLFLSLQVISFRLLILFAGNNSLFEESLIPVKELLDLSQRDFRHVYARLGTIQLNHLGNNLDDGDDFSVLNHIACFLFQLGDDTGDLRFDFDFMTRLDVAGRNGLGRNVAGRRLDNLIGRLHRLRFLPKEYESTNDCDADAAEEDKA